VGWFVVRENCRLEAGAPGQPQLRPFGFTLDLGLWTLICAGVKNVESFRRDGQLPIRFQTASPGCRERRPKLDGKMSQNKNKI